MTTKQVKMLVPQYVSQFKCIGAKCEESCCQGGWHIPIDQCTYKKYKHVTEFKLKKKLEKDIIRNRNNRTITNFAKAKLVNGRCSFLTEEGWCEIQGTLGEEYLSVVCRTYPRHINKVNGVLEEALVLSCPEATRLALLNRDIMTFDEVWVEDEMRGIVDEIDIPKEVKSWKDYFWEIRIFMIGLLQDRRYSLEERVFILGLFFKKLDKYTDKEMITQIPKIIEEYKTTNSKMYKKSFKDMPRVTNVQLEICQEIMELSRLKELGERYKLCLKELKEGLEWGEESDWEKRTVNYEKAYNLYYKPFMDEHSYIVENYLVNYTFKGLMPINKESPFESYVNLVLHYAFIKIQLIGVSAYYKGLTIDKVLMVIQCFSKEFEHNPQYFHQLIELIKKQSYLNLAYTCTLIKN